MSEPPILPNSNEPSSENPFAPSYVGTLARSATHSHLDRAYWIAFALLLIGSVKLYLLGLPLGWLGIFASVSAAVRVPLLQYRHAHPGFETGRTYLPSPLALLFTSLALNVAFIVVSFIAFAAICIPGTLTFGLSDARVVAVSGIIGFLSFCLLFFLSLRLPY